MSKWTSLLILSVFAAGLMSLVGGFTLSHGFERHNAPHPVISTTVIFESPPAMPSVPVQPQPHAMAPHVNPRQLVRTLRHPVRNTVG